MKQSSEAHYDAATVATAQSLKQSAEQLVEQDISLLSLPEVDEAVEIISTMVPAGNVPGVVLNGLARMVKRNPKKRDVQRDVNALFRGVEKVLDRATFGAFFAGPAAVIWGYQNLLKLAGKTPEDAFPDGTWQFYVDYALREDTARHTNETHGFESIINRENIRLHRVDRISAWVMSAIRTLHDYDALLENEWRERIQIKVFNDLTGNNFPRLYREWELQRPYGRASGEPSPTYAQYRREKFDDFMRDAVENAGVHHSIQKAWRAEVTRLEQQQLSAFQRQMSISSYLEATAYNEVHHTVEPKETNIGIIYNDGYYLIPTHNPDTGEIPDIQTIRSQVAAILKGVLKADAAHLTPLTTVKRSALPALIRQLPGQTQKSLEILHSAPILLNIDGFGFHYPLAQLRETERGIGSHPLTIIDTGATFIFDQSHIYFDGAWGAALAEILTQEAIHWGRKLGTEAQPAFRPYAGDIRALRFYWKDEDKQRIAKAPKTPMSSYAESRDVNLRTLMNLRKALRQRSDKLALTVNDLLVLFRAIHSVTYEPSAELLATLQSGVHDPVKKEAYSVALEAIREQGNPSILIPVDASREKPSERIFPLSFDVPLYEMSLLDLHRTAFEGLQEFELIADERTIAFQGFHQSQLAYLSSLAGYRMILNHAKEIALRGESASSGTIRLLAHLPSAMQSLLDEIPQHIDALNDIIKGREVFSNIGAVVKSSTLTRFIAAKDDNEKKTLAWGVITDANGVMSVTLRDFRPHVELLNAIGEHSLAQQITQDYLDNYTRGLNTYVLELMRITLATRETRLEL